MASSVKNGFEAKCYFDDREAANEHFVILRGLAQNHRAIGTVLPLRADGTGYSVRVTSGGPSLLEMRESPEIKRLFVDLADQSLLGHGKKETPIRISVWARKQIKVLVEFYEMLDGKMTPVPDLDTYGLSHPHKAENLYSQYIVFTKFTPYVNKKVHWDSLAKAIKKLRNDVELCELSVAEFKAFEAMLNENANPKDIYNLPIFFLGEDRIAYILRLHGFMKTNKEKLFWRDDLKGCFPDFMSKCREYTPLSALTTKIMGDVNRHVVVTLTPVPKVSAYVKNSNQQLYDHVNIMRHSYVHANSFIISSCMCPFSPELLFGLVFPDHVQLLWANHPV